MDQTGLAYTVEVADIDEKAITAGFPDRSKADPAQLTVAIAKAKAVEIAKKLREPALLITADQVACYNGTIREKPESEEVFIRPIHLAAAAAAAAGFSLSL